AGRHGGERMRVLGRADDYRVDLLWVVVDLAEIRDLEGVRVRLRGEVQIRFADVTENRHVLGLDAAQIVRPPPAGADDREIQLVVQVPAADDRRRGERGAAGRRRPVQKSPARQSLACGIGITFFSWHCGTSTQLNVIGRSELFSKSLPRSKRRRGKIGEKRKFR